MDSITLEIRSKYNSLNRTHKQIADYILDYTEDFLQHTSKEIGKYSRTSSSSVIRFAHYFDYTGLEELKRALVLDVHRNNVIHDPVIQENDSMNTIKHKMESLIGNGIKDYFYQVDVNAYEKAIQILKDSKKVIIVAVGASSLAGYDLYHKLSRLGKPVVFNFDSHMTLETMHYATKDDVLVMISYSGTSLECIYPGRIAQEKDIPILSITSQESSEVASLGDVVLTVPKGESAPRLGAIASKINTLVCVDMLYLGLISKDLKKLENDFLETSNNTKYMKNK